MLCFSLFKTKQYNKLYGAWLLLQQIAVHRKKEQKFTESEIPSSLRLFDIILLGFMRD